MGLLEEDGSAGTSWVCWGFHLTIYILNYLMGLLEEDGSAVTFNYFK